jgi:hypothetical protein
MRCPPPLVLCASLAVAGCVMPPSSMQRLSDSAYDLNTAVRFGRMDVASDYVREVAREEFAKKHARWGKSLRVVDLEMNGMSLRKDGDADVLVTVSWQRVDETSMRTTDLTQRWTSTRGSWSMISEEERSGDKGLISRVDTPEGEGAPPPQTVHDEPASGPKPRPPAEATRPRYQTRVIYEQ